MSYKSSKQLTWESSPLYHAMLYRKPETIAKEEVLDEFIDFLQNDSEFEYTDEELSNIQAMANEFLAFDLKKAEAGEKEMLANWKRSNERSNQ